MEHHYYFFTEILSGLGLGHFAHSFQHVVYSWFVMLVLIVGCALLAGGIQLLRRKGQNVLEVIVESLENFMVEITGPEGRAFFPFVATLFLYIFISNLIGLIPGFFSPTANINTPLSMALCTFVFTHYLGVRYHGFKYIKHFLGPIPWLAPLFFPIEIIGHTARVLSLTLRLFGNIMGEDLVLAILLLLAGKFLAPLPMMFLAVFTSTVQAFIFTLLAMMYFAGSMEHAH